MTGIEVVNTSSTDGFNIVNKVKILDNSELYMDIIFYLKSSQFPINVFKGKTNFENENKQLCSSVMTIV
jgi:hypothetical protein